MKYANLNYLGSKLNLDTSLINIGDYLQSLAISYIYKKMGLSDDDVLNLSPEEIINYEAEEYILLPLNWALFEKKFLDDNNRINLPHKVIPVFLSMTLGCAFNNSSFNSFNIQYLKNFEPIGCRDEVTSTILRQHGIKSYVNGCLTSVLPIRKTNSSQNKILLIDAPNELYEYIPKDYLTNSEVFNQQYYINNSIPVEDVKKSIVDRYQYYSDNAKIIITSRLHAASPALAMGIPVVFAKSKLDIRLSWLDKYLPLYTEKDFCRIDWHPNPVNFEDVKGMIISNCIRRITEAYNFYFENFRISKYFESRKKNNYDLFVDVLNNGYENAIQFFKNKYDNDDVFEYGIWGLNKSAENFYIYMCENYKNAKLTIAVDLYKKNLFHGVSPIEPEDMIISKIENLIVLPVGASNMAYDYFNKNGICESTYCICGETYISTSKINTIY